MKISIRGLGKVYKQGNRALKHVDLEIGNGMFGLLGPNGAGKTTLMRILVTLMEPTEGTVSFDGLDLMKNRRQIRTMLGYLPQEFRMFSRLKTWEFLDYSAQLAGISGNGVRREAVSKMLESVGLFEARDRQANKLSGGMKRRLGIAQALIGNPKVLVVDEPTKGLDPEERLRFRNLLADMSREERIIILSTHIVGDISSTCENMAMLDQGDVVFHGSPEKLIEQARGHVWLIDALDSEVAKINEKYSVITAVPSKHGLEVQVVCDNLEGFTGKEIEPNLEHAYVYFLEKRASAATEYALLEDDKIL
jgi:ABC-type multidrug transport system ATPase subunit